MMKLNRSQELLC